MSDLVNPYSPPDANLTHSTLVELASYGQRLGGSIIDTLIILVIMGAVALGAVFAELEMSPDALTLPMLAVGFGSWFAINAQPLVTRGQTVGKIVVGSQIVGYQDARIPSLWRTGALRYVLVGLIGGVPVVGSIFSVVDILFVFREDRRCIHDLLAGTQVVVYRPDRA